MSVNPLKGPFIQASGYSRGRLKGDVLWLVLHTAEGVTDELGLGTYFKTGTRKASSNAGVGQDGGYAEYVTYNNTPWTNPPINSQSDTLEICAFKVWTRRQWLTREDMLETVAHWLAWRSVVRGIPLVLISGAQAVRGIPGVIDHRRVNDGFHKSDHTDIGKNFPWDVVITRAQQILRTDRHLVAGMSGNDVGNVQNALNALGNKLKITKVMDAPTIRVLKIFQAHRDIPVTGEVDTATWAKLHQHA